MIFAHILYFYIEIRNDAKTINETFNGALTYWLKPDGEHIADVGMTFVAYAQTHLLRFVVDFLYNNSTTTTSCTAQVRIKSKTCPRLVQHDLLSCKFATNRSSGVRALSGVSI